MRWRWFALILAAVLAPTGSYAGPAPRPHVVVILADDLGYSDIGSYGGEIRTSNIDALAASGVRFTQFYTTPRCSPSRASLLTGLHPHRAGMGHLPDVTHAATADVASHYVRFTAIGTGNLLLHPVRLPMTDSANNPHGRCNQPCNQVFPDVRESDGPYGPDQMVRVGIDTSSLAPFLSFLLPL